MSIITDRFLQEAEKKKLEFSSRVVERNLKDKEGNEIPHQQLILQTALRVNEEKVVPCSLFIHDTDDMDYVNYQITYNRIGPLPTLNTFMHGGRILRAIMPELSELNGLDLSTNLD